MAHSPDYRTPRTRQHISALPLLRTPLTWYERRLQTCWLSSSVQPPCLRAFSSLSPAHMALRGGAQGCSAQHSVLCTAHSGFLCADDRTNYCRHGMPSATYALQ